MKKRQIFYNSVSGAVLFGVNVVVAFLLSPVIVRQLGDRGYGIWEIFLGVFGYLSILELGVGPAFIRFVARAAAQNDQETMHRVVSSALAILVGAGLLGFVVANVLLSVPHLLKIDPNVVPQVRLLGLLLGGNFFVQLAGTVFTAYLMGMQRHDLINGTRILLVILQSTAVYLALTRGAGPGLVRLAEILLCASTLEAILFATWSLTRKPAPSIRMRHVRRQTIRELYAFGLKSVTLMASTRVAAGSIPILIGWVLGSGQVVFYAIPNRLATYAAGLGAALGFPLMPYFSALDGRGDRQATLHAWFTTTRALQFAMIGMAVGLLSLGGPFIARWIGPTYAERGLWVIRCLGVVLLIEALCPNSNRLLVSINRHGRAAVAALVVAIVGVPLTFALLEVAGIPGVGIALLIVRGATALVWIRLALLELEITVWEHVRRTVLTFAPAGLLFLGLVLVLRRWHEAVDYPHLVAYALVGGAAYLIGAWLFAVHGTEKDALLRHVAGLRRRKMAAVP